MNIDEFIHAPEEIWQPIPNTRLSASSYGRIVETETKKFFGEITYMEDLEFVLSGEIPVWDTDSVNPTLSPKYYFNKRTRLDKESEAEWSVLLPADFSKRVH